MGEQEPHTLRCDGPPLVKGARQERPWSCSCGARFHGFDGAVRRAHREHVTSPGERR